MAQLVKNLPAMQENWDRSLGWEDPLEKEKATHSSILAWRIHGLYSPRACKELDTTEQLSLSQAAHSPGTGRDLTTNWDLTSNADSGVRPALHLWECPLLHRDIWMSSLRSSVQLLSL